MSAHNDYSSDEEDLFDENIKSEVLLGFVDTDIIEDGSDEDLPTLEDTFIGGKPIWLHPESRPSENQLKCGNCGSLMALLMQAFAPLDGKLYDRIIYIFACKNTVQCSKKKGSVKCLRGLSKDPKKMAELKAEQEEVARLELDKKLALDNKKKFNIEMTKDLFSSIGSTDKSNAFNTSSNPFESTTNPFSNSNSNPFAKESPVVGDNSKEPESYASIASKKSSTLHENSKNTKVLTDDSLPSYPGSFVYVEQEKLKKITSEPEIEKYKHLIEGDDDGDFLGDKKEGSSTANELNPQAAKISNMLDDKYFEAFSRTVEHNPAQVLRYNIGGRPLLYSGRDDVASKFIGDSFNVPVPAFNPSSSRQFELQLMPKAILDLEQKTGEISVHDILNGMSWGTIIVCTDIEDFIPDEKFDSNSVAYIEEWCGVQWEESV